VADQISEDIAAALFDRFDRPDLVGFQGPVLAFERGVRLEEAGSGVLLAEAFGVPVAWDFLRQDFILNGASVLMAQAEFTAAMLCQSGETGRAVHLSLDTRSQMFWVENGAVVQAMETGPGLGLLAVTGQGQGGRVAPAIPEDMLADPFFLRIGPRVTNAELLDKAAAALEGLAPSDAGATAAAMIVAGALQALEVGPFRPETLFVSGPGATNPDLQTMLRAGLRSGVDMSIRLVEGTCIQGQATGFLAARLVRGLTVAGPNITGAPTAMASGVLSRPTPK